MFGASRQNRHWQFYTSAGVTNWKKFCLLFWPWIEPRLATFTWLQYSSLIIIMPWPLFFYVHCLLAGVVYLLCLLSTPSFVPVTCRFWQLCFLLLLNFISDKWTRHLLAFQIAEELQSFDCWYDGHSQDSVGAYYRKEEVESCWWSPWKICHAGAVIVWNNFYRVPFSLA